MDSIIRKLYTDSIDSKISDERFARMTASYEVEQRTLKSHIRKLKAAISTEVEKTA